MELFRNNFHNVIFYFLLHIWFSKKDKKINQMSQLFWCLLNKLQVTWEIFANLCGLLKNLNFTKFALHNSVTVHYLSNLIYSFINQAKIWQQDIFSWDSHEFYMFSMQIVLQWLDKSFRRPCVCNSIAMTTMGQFNEWHFPLLLCMLHTCQNICGKSRELKHWRKKNYSECAEPAKDLKIWGISFLVGKIYPSWLK